MDTESNAYILSALQELSEEQWKKLLFAVQKQFGRQLQNIPEAPSAEDLVHEALADLLEGRRSWPQDKVSLPGCLRNIVWSKVNHLATKAATAGHVYVQEEVIDWEVDEDCTQKSENALLDGIETVKTLDNQTLTALRKQIFQELSYDETLERILIFWLDRLDDDVNAANIADELQSAVSESRLRKGWDDACAIIRENLKELKERELRERMLDCVQQDAELTKILTHRFNSPEAKARDIASELKIPITQVYNASRRLKTNACLKRLHEQL